jgi:hypothetical protein
MGRSPGEDAFHAEYVLDVALVGKLGADRRRAVGPGSPIRVGSVDDQGRTAPHQLENAHSGEYLDVTVIVKFGSKAGIIATNGGVPSHKRSQPPQLPGFQS